MDNEQQMNQDRINNELYTQTEYINQLNKQTNTQTKYLQAILKELQSIRGSVTALLIIQLIPIIAGLIALIIGILTGVGAFSFLNRLF